MKVKTKLCYIRALLATLPSEEIPSQPAVSGIHLGDHETLVATDGKTMVLVDVEPELRDTVTPANFTFIPRVPPHPLTAGDSHVHIDTSSRILTVDRRDKTRFTSALIMLPERYPDWKRIWSAATRSRIQAPAEKIGVNLLQIYRIAQVLGAKENLCQIKYRDERLPLEIHWDGFPDLRMIVAPFSK